METDSLYFILFPSMLRTFQWVGLDECGSFFYFSGSSNGFILNLKTIVSPRFDELTERTICYRIFMFLSFILLRSLFNEYIW